MMTHLHRHHMGVTLSRHRKKNRVNKSPIFTVPRRGQSFLIRAKTSIKKSGKDKLKGKMVTKLLQLKTEMEEISEQQSCIREGQRQVKQRFEAIESECKNLRAETMKIMQQSGLTRLRLALMFQVLKARENQDFTKAAELTHALRELISQQNQKVGPGAVAVAPTAGDK